jgi:hypothetical protein
MQSRPSPQLVVDESIQLLLGTGLASLHVPEQLGDRPGQWLLYHVPDSISARLPGKGCGEGAALPRLDSRGHGWARRGERIAAPRPATHAARRCGKFDGRGEPVFAFSSTREVRTSESREKADTGGPGTARAFVIPGKRVPGAATRVDAGVGRMAVALRAWYEG